MRPNPLIKLLNEDRAIVNGWLAIPNSFSAEVMAHQGWDSLTVDMQHGISDYQNAVTMFQAICTTSTAPLTRVPWLEEGIVMRMLDAGAYGVICPMINKASDAERFVQACYYPPFGQRSFGPIRALFSLGADYPSHANDEILSDVAKFGHDARPIGGHMARHLFAECEFCSILAREEAKP